MKSSLSFGLFVFACGGTTVQHQPDGGAGASGAAGAGAGGANSGGANTGGANTGGANTGGGNTGGASTGGTGGAGWKCPDTPPRMGDPCTRPIAGSGSYVTAHCAWGTDPRVFCRTKAACQMDGTWYVTAPNAQACTDPPLPSDCPDPAPAQGAVCSTTNRSCNYADGTLCNCSACMGGRAYPICQQIMPPQWSCSPRPMGCPTIVPNAGTACDTPGASCGVVGDCMTSVTCQGGQWLWSGSSCPVCASPDTPIATPSGERRIADLRIGDLVYSVDHEAVVAVPLLATGSTPVVNHHVVRVVLGDGTVLEMSAGHPTGKGVPFGDLSAGHAFDDLHRIRSAELVPYTHDRTYDILPDSTTGTYFAGGAWVGSTLHHTQDVASAQPGWATVRSTP